MKNMGPELSVVVLCYKTGEDIIRFAEETISCLNEELDNWELILVGNYFEDMDDITPKVVRDIAKDDNRIKPITKIKEGMMGWDARSGFAEARGDVIAYVDGDGQINAEEITRAYRVLKEGAVDLVTTYRTKRDDGLYRIVISKVYNLIFKILFHGLNVRDVNSKPKVITRTAYDKLNLTSNDWFLDAEIMIQAGSLNLKITEIPTQFNDLKNRKSFVKFSAIFEFIKNLIIARMKLFFR